MRPLGKYNAVQTDLPQLFRRKMENFLLTIRSSMKNLQNFFYQMSCREVKSILDSVKKILKNEFFEGRFFKHVECTFENSARKN